MAVKDKSKGKEKSVRAVQIPVNGDLLNALASKTGQPQEVFVMELTKLAEAHLHSQLQSADDDHYCEFCHNFTSKTHVPNKTTVQGLQDSREGKNLSSYGSLEEMWAKLGI